MAKVIGVLVLALFALVNNVNAVCFACIDPNSATCVDETHFQYCIFEQQTGPIYACEEGKICAADGTCQTQIAGSPALGCVTNCAKCDGPSGKAKYACVSPTEFSPCDGKGAVMPARFSCPNNKLCDIAQYAGSDGASVDKLCYSQCDANPSCPVLSPEQQPAESCAGVVKKGGYLNKSDPTCKTYVYCEPQTGGTIYAQVFNCTGTNAYFDKTSGNCVPTKPASCI